MCKSSRPLVVITPVCISGPHVGPHIAWNKIIQTPSPWLNCENVAFESPISLLRCLNFTYLQVLAAFVSFFHSQMIHVRNIYLHLPQKMAQFCRYIFHTSSIDWVFSCQGHFCWNRCRCCVQLKKHVRPLWLEWQGMRIALSHMLHV